MWPCAYFKYWCLESDDKASMTYAGPFLRFYLPSFTIFSSCPVSFSAFAILNINYYLKWIKFCVDLISWSVVNFTFGMYSISQLKVFERFKKLNLKNYVFTFKSFYTHKLTLVRANLHNKNEVSVFLSSSIKSYSNSLSLVVSLATIDIWYSYR